MANDEYDQVLMTKLMIQSTVSYLQNFDVKQLHIFVDPIVKNLHDRLTDIDYTGIIENNPNELDYHPGVDAHKEIASWHTKGYKMAAKKQRAKPTRIQSSMQELKPKLKESSSFIRQPMLTDG